MHYHFPHLQALKLLVDGVIFFFFPLMMKVVVAVLCLCVVVFGLDNGLGLTPPMGWNTVCIFL